MDATRLVKVSKYLAKHLRHDPAGIGLVLEPGGWVEVADLLEACERNHLQITRADLEEVVTSNDKQRFGFSDDGTKIRANQGHSVDVDLELSPQTPPETLYHGTAEATVPILLQEGIKKMRRHHVHLSAQRDTAYKVGSRHGKPAILVIDTYQMRQGGFVFYQSENGVWLVDHVPPRYIERED